MELFHKSQEKEKTIKKNSSIRKGKTNTMTATATKSGASITKIS